MIGGRKLLAIVCMMVFLSWSMPVIVQADRFVYIDTLQFTETIDQQEIIVEDIIIQLFENDTPATVNNFLNYVNGSYYNDTFIHRVVDQPGVIQGGGNTWNYDQEGYIEVPTLNTDGQLFTPEELVPWRVMDDWGQIHTNENILVPPFPVCPNEYQLPNTRGTIAMAKTGNSLVDEQGNVLVASEDSATNEWFINTNDNSDILNENNNGGFTVFGEVIDGMDVVDKIAALTRYNTVVFPDLPLIDYLPGSGYVTQDNLVLFYDFYEITLIPGDINLDQLTNAQDLGILLAQYGVSNIDGWKDGDLNNDGSVNAMDLGNLLANYGQTASPETSPVNTPEPASGMILLMLAMTGLSRYGRLRSVAG